MIDMPISGAGMYINTIQTLWSKTNGRQYSEENDILLPREEVECWAGNTKMTHIYIYVYICI